MGRLINCGYEDDRNRPRAEAGEGFHGQGANDPSDAPASEPSGVRSDAGSDLADAVSRQVADVAPDLANESSCPDGNTACDGSVLSAANVRSVAEIRTTGAAWVTEKELAWLCDLAERGVSDG